tara:strand:- start:2118 stop:2300 length:183 start_codon:yes stop_codon:yes gene_type:complete
MVEKLSRTTERTNPKQTAQATAIQNKMKWLAQFKYLFSQAFQGELISTAKLGMPAVTEAL